MKNAESFEHAQGTMKSKNSRYQAHKGDGLRVPSVCHAFGRGRLRLL
ncbi:MAG: hypothetical protein IKN49_02580 [Elusimicrobiaceae bacterium]|nr:hypothetical protein [Elusimicrobiaceae bacterium]